MSSNAKMTATKTVSSAAKGPKNAWEGLNPQGPAPPDGTRVSSSVISVAVLRSTTGQPMHLIAATGAGRAIRFSLSAASSSSSSSSSSVDAAATTAFYYHVGPLWATGVGQPFARKSCANPAARVSAAVPWYFTGGDDKFLCGWEAAYHRLIARVRTPLPIRCCAVDAACYTVVVGCVAGTIALYSIDNAVESTTSSSSSSASSSSGETSSGALPYTLTMRARRKDCKEDISDVKFSPNNRLLAVGSHDNFIDM